MSDKKVSQLDATTTLKDTDLLVVSSDNGDATYSSKKITGLNASTSIAHNNLASKQGGTTNEFYHLSAQDYSQFDHTGNIIIPKTANAGIKVDLSSPTFGWKDLLGSIHARGTGAADPSFNVYNGNLRGYQFSVNDEVWVEFHLPHDYVPNSNIFIHTHWSHKETGITGGSVTWGLNVSYAKGYDQGSFANIVTTTIQQNASTTQYQHMIAEVQLSSLSPTASQLDSAYLEIDGILLVRVYLSANNMTGYTPVREPFLHFVDIHYQSTQMSTKDKNYPFYT